MDSQVLDGPTSHWGTQTPGGREDFLRFNRQGHDKSIPFQTLLCHVSCLAFPPSHPFFHYIKNGLLSQGTNIKRTAHSECITPGEFKRGNVYRGVGGAQETAKGNAASLGS